MPLTTGQSLTFYEILGPLGAGGMGEVYRARDTRLDRDVAIKVLPEELADDDERLRRFEREAKTLASLNHPNVAGIHGIDQVDDTCFIAMELVPGEDLSQRLERGALSVEEAVDVCRQIAEGLEAAHEAGVVHRDLKPANVRITPDGVVKVLDFGLAKPIHAQSSGTGISTAQADSFLMTAEGLVLGTPTYMSPEQARGKPVDRRTDIWAFGCVLYECLTGKRAFGGETVSDVLAAVLERDLDATRLPAALPQHVHELLLRCLTKNPRMRLRDMGEARVLLERGSSGSGAFVHAAPGESAAGSGIQVPAVIAIALVAALLGGVALRALWPATSASRTEMPLRQSELVAPAGTSYFLSGGPPAVSRDGARVAFSAIDEEGRNSIWVRELDGSGVRQIPRTENGENPFWSPDGLQLGFSNEHGLQTIGIDENRPHLIFESHDVTGASWNESGTILFGQADGPIMSVDVRDRTSRVVHEHSPDNPEAWGMWPCFLPDGIGFLFAIQDKAGMSSGVYAGRLGSTEVRRLTTEASNVMYLDSGELLYRRGGALYASAFDLETHELDTESVRVVKDVRLDDWPVHALFGASSTGLIVYVRQLPGVVDTEFVWVDMETGAVEPLGIEGILWNPSLSPDGEKLAFDRSTLRTSGDVWVRDLVRGVEVQITKAPSDDSNPIWTPAGDEIYFYVTPDIFRSDPAGLREPELVLEGIHTHDPHGLTADGNTLLFSGRTDPDPNTWLCTLDLTSGEIVKLLPSEFGIRDAQLSPDGGWVAVRLDGDAARVVIATFPNAKHATLIPTGPGHGLRWSRDGSEILFSDDGQILAVPLEFRPNAPPIAGDTRVVLERVGNFDVGRRFELSLDGRRLLVARTATPERDLPLTLLENAIP